MSLFFSNFAAKLINYMLNFISFGSGSSGNSYLLYTETDGLLIDAGIGSRNLKKRFKQFGLNVAMIKNILVTHDHADHIKAVGSLALELGVNVYTTRKVHQGIQRNYCTSKKVPVDKQKDIEKGMTFDVGEFSVTPFAVPHDSLDCVGYMVEYGSIAFCLMTDVGIVTEEMKRFITRANYLVIEANHDVEMLKSGTYPQNLKDRILSDKGHLSNASCAEAIINNMSEHLKHIWLCHLSEENNHPELARKTVEATLRSHGVIVGKDVELDVLKRTFPTGPFELH